MEVAALRLLECGYTLKHAIALREVVEEPAGLSTTVFKKRVEAWLVELWDDDASPELDLHDTRTRLRKLLDEPETTHESDCALHIDPERGECDCR